MKIFISGMPASGKSTFGKSLSGHLDLHFYDLDELVEAKGRTIDELFAESEAAFRAVEKQTLSEFLEQHGNESFCLALGGGTLELDGVAQLLKEQGILIYLDVDIDEIGERLSQKSESERRPMFIDLNSEQIGSKLKKIWDLRKAKYWKSHIITGVQEVQEPELLTKRIELFTKFG